MRKKIHFQTDSGIACGHNPSHDMMTTTKPEKVTCQICSWNVPKYLVPSEAAASLERAYRAFERFPSKEAHDALQDARRAYEGARKVKV